MEGRDSSLRQHRCQAGCGGHDQEIRGATGECSDSTLRGTIGEESGSRRQQSRFLPSIGMTMWWVKRHCRPMNSFVRQDSSAAKQAFDTPKSCPGRNLSATLAPTQPHGEIKICNQI